MSPDSSQGEPAVGGPNAQPMRPGLWLLEEEVAHLNHGSYGAVPTPVLEAQRAASEAIERSPDRFYRSELFQVIEVVRERVAAFLGVEAASVALVQNVTEAAQVALDALALAPGSEIVCTDHAYPWVRAAIDRAVAARGLVLRSVALPTAYRCGGVGFEEALVAALHEAITSRTGLVVLDQITSASALRFPVERLCRELAGNVPVMIDGAHAPGLVEAPVPQGATFWFGNLHKWAFSARTAAALVVAPEWRERVRPLVASFGGSRGYPDSFTYLGTQDPSAYLALPAALAFPEEHLGVSFENLRERNAAVLDQGIALVASALGLRVPRSNGLPMRTLQLGREGEGDAAWALGNRLRDRGVEVATSSLHGELLMRVSVQAYVGLEDFERLVAALEAEGIGR